MQHIYPNLPERHGSERVCSVCRMETESTWRYNCRGAHAVCRRCKIHQDECPTCRSTLQSEIAPVAAAMPFVLPQSHVQMPQPMQPHFDLPYPTAPPMENFLAHERNNWPPVPPLTESLVPCSYSHLGCMARLQVHLKEAHEDRCQHRPDGQNAQYPKLLNCRYQSVGCQVKIPAPRKSIHEKNCNYKEKFESVNGLIEGMNNVTVGDREYGDPEDLVACKYKRFGCMVNMPRRRKQTHESKCNYRKDDEDDEDPYLAICPPCPYDPDERLPCVWSEYGCRATPKRCTKPLHESKCNYRREECKYAELGCQSMFEPSRRFAHERSCPFAQ